MITPYQIKLGIQETQIPELLELTTTDKEIHENTSDWRTPEGKLGRFSSLQAFTAWQKQDKTIYTLTSPSQLLAGIVWFTPKPIDYKKYAINQKMSEKYPITFAIRLYGEARGHKLAKPFLLETIKKYCTFLGEKHVFIWIEVHKANERALHIYHEVGFRQVKTSSDGKQVLLLADLSDKL